MNGPSLLDEFREHRSERAFAALVRQYAGLVFSAARRRVGDVALAEDISQSVFLRLSQSLPRVSTEAELTGWLHRTTLHLSIDQWRSEARRRAREMAASSMSPPALEPDPESLWTHLTPHLDDAVDELSEPDRQAILLRFFEQRKMRELGDALGVSEAAAKMRVSRALEKLRLLLAARGVVCGTALLGSVLGERTVEPVADSAVTRWTQAGPAVPPVTATTPVPVSPGPVSSMFSLLSGAKRAVAVAALLVAGWSVRQWTAPSPAASSGASETVADAQVTENSPGDPGLRNPGSPMSAVETLDLEDAKRLLRELLQNPPASRSYPPPRLVEALGRFGNQLQESVPILVAAASASDYETRVWAFSGIQRVLHTLRTTGPLSEYGDALVLVRPVLGAALLGDGVPGMLKMSALMSLVPPVVRGNGVPDSVLPADPESLDWVERALRVTPKREDGFRFTIVDQLVLGRDPGGPELEVVRRMEPMLGSASGDDRLLAAYALALAPGAKPSAVKTELLQALRETSVHSYRAARALAGLGDAARDTVPELLAFAQKTSDLGGGGYTQAALETACRLQPDLRGSHPDIDAKLKLEEQALQSSTNPKGIREQVLEWAAIGDDVALRALTGGIQHAPDAASAAQQKDQLLRILGSEMASATPGDRAVLERIADRIRRMEIPPDEDPVAGQPVDIRDLLLEARVLLTDSRNPNAGPIEEALDRFLTEQVHTGVHTNVTAESFAVLAKALDGIDPRFRSEWHKAVLLSMPSLDRVLPKPAP